MDTGQGGQEGTDNNSQEGAGETGEALSENLRQPQKEKRPKKFEIIRLN